LQFDNRIFRWTEYPQDLVLFDGQTYGPAQGGDTSARDAIATLEASNKEFKGFAVLETGDGLTQTEIRNGALVGAYLDEYLVDWRTPWLAPLHCTRYFIKSATMDGSLWRLDCQGLSYIYEDQVGEYWGPLCRSELFDSGIRKCNLPTSGKIIASSILHVYPGDTGRYKIKVSAFGAFAADNWANDGKVYFLSGAMSGRIGNIKQWDYLGSNQADLYLQERSPHPLTVGMNLTLYPGCDKTLATCKAKFNNVINFQGEPWIPGGDAGTRGVSTKF
jgi:uncharacterized phage protein (TIGR02218 family)